MAGLTGRGQAADWGVGGQTGRERAVDWGVGGQTGRERASDWARGWQTGRELGEFPKRKNAPLTAKTMAPKRNIFMTQYEQC